VAEEILGDVIEERERAGVVLWCDGCAIASARGHQWERGGGCESGDDFAAREDSVRHG
jgi:hypothetical protein